MNLQSRFFALLGIAISLNATACSALKVNTLDLPSILAPKVPVVHTIGWWNYQKSLEVTDFKVEVVRAKLDLFHSASQVRFHIAGTITPVKRASGQPYIKKVQISERLVDAADGEPVVEIDITPVVDFKGSQSPADPAFPFETAVDYTLDSHKWMDNRYVFRCGAIERRLTLRQDKSSHPDQRGWAR